jgi:hypothetical protein
VTGLLLRHAVILVMEGVTVPVSVAEIVDAIDRTRRRATRAIVDARHTGIGNLSLW